MSRSPVEERLLALEQEVARLKAKVLSSEESDTPWLDRIFGAFENNAAFKEAMRFGAEYRRSLKPKQRKSKKA